jgi:hypothetical protein
MNIPEKAGQIKTWLTAVHGQVLLIILILIISNIASFSLGRKSTNKDKSPLGQINTQENNYSLADPEIPKTGTLAAAIMAQNEPNREESTNNESGLNTSGSPRYVASRKGRVYYFTWCSGAKNITTENRVYYKSANDARAAGLSPSKACPDLD